MMAKRQRKETTTKEQKEQEKAAKRAKKAEKKEEKQELKDEIAELRRMIATIPTELKITPSKVEEEDQDEVPPARVARGRKQKALSLGKKQKFPIGHKLATPEPTTICAQRRLVQFPNQSLRPHEEQGVPTLYCEACQTVLSLIKQRIRVHLKTHKHRKGLAEIGQAEALQKVFDQTAPRPGERVYGDTLPKSVTDSRLHVLRALIQAAVPREKLYAFRELRNLLEKGGSCSLPRNGLDQLIKRVAEGEDFMLKSELENVQFASIIFDGASEVTEVFAVVIRFWDGCIRQRAISMSWLARNMNATQQATHLISQMNRRVVDPQKLICSTIHDGASVNGACVKELQRHSPHIIDITCVSHTVCLCEKGFHCPTALVFLSEWGTMIASSWRSREKFQEMTSQQPLRPARVKWFAMHEVVEQVVHYWPQMNSLIDDDHGCFSSTLREKMRVLLREKRWMLKLELALMYDIGRALIRLCYLQEGDGLLAPLVYDDLQNATSTFTFWILKQKGILVEPETRIQLTQTYLPNLYAIAVEYVAAKKDKTLLQVIDDNLVKAKGVADIFSEHFGGANYQAAMHLWKFCRLFNPNYVKTITIDALEAECKVAVCPQPLRRYRQQLIKEIAVYYGIVQALEKEVTSLQHFWRKTENLPTWKICVEFVSLLQPSSGAAERAFAVLRGSFDSQQESTLADYKETSVLIRFNDRARESERKLLKRAESDEEEEDD